MAAQAHEMCSYVGAVDIFSECVTAMEWDHFYTWCMYDMCSRMEATDNTPLCIVMAAMAKECAANGIYVDWTVTVCAGQ